MRKAGKLCAVACGGWLAISGCAATEDYQQEAPAPAPVSVASAVNVEPVLSPSAGPDLPASPNLPVLPTVEPQDRPLPINLPTALQLADVRAVDIAAATEQIQAAIATLQLAQAQWLPTITFGGDYYGHTGPIQDVSNAVYDDSHNSLMVGAGVGIGPAAVFTLTDALFAPLAAKQQVNASRANRQAAANNTLVAVTDAYFTVQQARGELAGAVEATRLTEDLVARTRKLAPAVVPELELFRAETELARRHEAESLARERWRVASADLLRVLRLDPAAQVQPVEPPQLRVDLIDLHKQVDELIPIALTFRPELAAQQAQVQQTLARLKQERWRPLLPSVVLSGASTPGSNLNAGGFVPYPGSTVSGLRGDINAQVLWQLNGLGVGNAALIHQRQAENRLADVELIRIQDLVAAEVSQAYAQAQEAARRVEWAERGLRFGLQSAEKNLAALREAKGVGNQLVGLVRPQEVVAAIQALSQSYLDYYGAVADANRAQFRLYRALGQPAQYLAQEQQMRKGCGPDLDLPATPAQPADETHPSPGPLPGEADRKDKLEPAP